MKGEFKRLLLKEFGKSNYKYYVSQILADKDSDEILSIPVIKSMTKALILKSNGELTLMETRLNETMISSYYICKGFVPYLLTSILVVMLIQFIVGTNLILFISAVSVLICLSLRLTQYIINKYCYIDARLILSYRISLDIAKKLSSKE